MLLAKNPSVRAMIQRDPLRLWISRNIQPLAFLSAYFVTIVAGNLIYATPWGAASLRASGLDTALLTFENTFTFGFWALLLCPFVVTPITVFLTRKVAAVPLNWASSFVSDLTPGTYAALTVLCYAFVGYRFWLADVAALFISGTDAVSSVEARFEILDRIGYFTLVTLQSFLPFLAIYSLIRATRDRILFWILATIFNTTMMSILLILLNMKWPVLLFYIGLVMAVFVYSARWAYLKAAVGAMLLVIAFLMVSTFVFRLAPASGVSTSELDAARNATTSEAIATTSEAIATTSEAAASHAPVLLIVALNRMAVTYPYYYQIFTKEGSVCGGLLAQLHFGQKCRPSTLVYSRIFRADGFEGRGTSPSSVHVSGYALGGWPMAFFMLISASVILGVFASLPLDHSAVAGTVAIVGAMAGYHMSQLPLEGVIIFDHGLLWTALLLLVILVWSVYRRRDVHSGRQSLKGIVDGGTVE
ncbi:hypothetical protein [Ollibium composti]|uniref:Oligosaccharide repeat unit polymerase n=1 Tax=Ollibium composti TaxID=2675109 RepID=A0ABY2Q5J3_9HYPH|nr:hypothetical protein [Mesorhizobium composti]THF56594.1 hypothetical protein E6C48_12795 [Mesorhizobium composti]